MAKLSKEQKKAMIQKAEEERAKHPQEKKGSGFANLDKEAERLQNSQRRLERGAIAPRAQPNNYDNGSLNFRQPEKTSNSHFIKNASCLFFIVIFRWFGETILV